ncbi:tetratricopeptide repeat protein [Xanthobacter sp. 91]|uniref:tetratricopeptide repeat protein n=1 Tax=Xanthobacter sp. 91 TaxID=1117244 RepID=UPI0009DE18BC|nr:tetratricopeptide repeat protein [Xanthobacter sp. 91]
MPLEETLRPEETSRPAPLRRIAGALTLALALAFTGPALAGSKDGTQSRAYAAYAKGDYVTAAALLIPLAWQGDAKAQGMVGYLYENGKGVPQDFVVAAQWYGCAAEQGDPTAQYLLGLAYDKGRGVPIDVVLSQKWLILAAARAGKQERDTFTRIRDAVRTKMSRAQIAAAQEQAILWMPAPPYVPEPLWLNRPRSFTPF